MPNPILRARWLAPALLLVLSACDRPDAQARLEARQAAYDPPRLWRVAAGSGHDAPTQLFVCADTPLRAGFQRATAEINGRFCAPFKDGIERPGLYAVRCEMDGRRYGLTVNSRGDLERDFTSAFALTTLDGSGVTARQIRRFTDVGPCPAGWAIGDQARPGGRRTSALSGAWATP